MRRLLSLLLGILFGIVMYKCETASWFRIYEMFRFQSIHMYGFMGTALVVGIVGVQMIKWRKVKDIKSRPIVLKDKEMSITRYLLGGLLFGIGWALLGACPGPIFVLLGTGLCSMGVVIVFALLGTFLYGVLRKKLPH